MACISSRISAVIHLRLPFHPVNKDWFNELFAVSPYGGLYLDVHGLVFETSICYWQDQPDIRRYKTGDRYMVGFPLVLYSLSFRDSRGTENIASSCGDLRPKPILASSLLLEILSDLVAQKSFRLFLESGFFADFLWFRSDVRYRFSRVIVLINYMPISAEGTYNVLHQESSDRRRCATVRQSTTADRSPAL